VNTSVEKLFITLLSILLRIFEDVLIKNHFNGPLGNQDLQ
jgi:hypothetical protein